MATVNRKTFRIVAGVLFTLAAIIFVWHTIVLSQRTDGETVFRQGEAVVIDNEKGHNHTLILCVPDKDSCTPGLDSCIDFRNANSWDDWDDSPKNALSSYRISNKNELIDGKAFLDDEYPSLSALFGEVYGVDQLSHRLIKFHPPRVLDLQSAAPNARNLGSNPQCSISDPFTNKYAPYAPEDKLRQVLTPDNTFAIAIHEDSPASWYDLLSIVLFLLLLWIGVVFASKSGLFLPKTRTTPHPLNALLAFLGVLLLSYLITRFMMPPRPTDREILPGFAEMYVLLGSNFISFLGIAAVFRWGKPVFNKVSGKIFIKDLLPKTKAPAFANNAGKASHTGDDNELRKESIGLPFWAAAGLVFIALISVGIAPDPGITLSELASKLVSTGYLTAYFAILAGVCEECLFRGVIQTSLMPGPNARHPKLQNVIAIAITTILFAFMHVPQSMEHLWALIPIALVSIVSGILRVRSGAIYQSILLHISYNAILLMPSLIALMKTVW